METYAGADLHKRVTQLAVLREGKTASQYRFGNDPRKVEGVLRRLPAGTKIALEATGTWWWFVEKARAMGHEVYLTHPKQTKAIASARLTFPRQAGLLGHAISQSKHRCAKTATCHGLSFFDEFEERPKFLLR